MRLYFMPLLAALLGMGFTSSDFEELIGTDDLKALQEIIVATVASCPAKVLTNSSDLSFAKRQLLEIGGGIAEIISEASLTLALKKDYPNACHVMSASLLARIEAETDTRKNCLVKSPGGGCLVTQRQQFPVYRYHWPKYFVEVSQKGNDPHPAFAASNKLYSASRKLAHELSSWSDLSGPYKLVAKVVGAAGAIKGATKSVVGQGFDFDVSSEELARAGQTAVLTPFERMRIRAAQDPTMPAFDVNIWPVGLSKAIAEKLTVCGQGGFAWPIPGVPMTCPVAMSADAWSYWDSGMLDYLNPHAIRGIAAASSPLTCVSEHLAGVGLDSYSSKDFSGTSESQASVDRKQGALANLPANLRGVGVCSLPILGDAEGVASQFLALSESFTGPWCTLWGPVVPRASTHVYINDYSLPNAALKFKLLAHDLFGIPRGKKERWALAYPWESGGLERVLEAAAPLFEQFGGRKIANDYLKVQGAGRSEMLVPPGSPLLLDSFSVESMGTDAKNFAREIAYLGGLSLGASEAEMQALRVFQDRQGLKAISQEKVLNGARENLEKVTDETSRLKEEPIFERRVYCEVKGEKHGHFTEQDHELAGEAFASGTFEQVHDIEDCHRAREGSCLDRHPVSGKCRRPESISYVSVVKWEIVRYEQAPNPRQYVVSPSQCTRHQYRTPNTHQRHLRCSENLKMVGRDDTRRRSEDPDPLDAEKTVGQGSEAGKQAAAAAGMTAWVGAELARARYEQIAGKSLLPGKKRVYTIFEEVECTPKALDGGQIYRKKVPGGWVWNSCESAIRIEVLKYFQEKLLRRVCDKALGYKLGDPFKRSE